MAALLAARTLPLLLLLLLLLLLANIPFARASWWMNGGNPQNTGASIYQGLANTPDNHIFFNASFSLKNYAEIVMDVNQVFYVASDHALTAYTLDTEIWTVPLDPDVQLYPVGITSSSKLVCGGAIDTVLRNGSLLCFGKGLLAWSRSLDPAPVRYSPTITVATDLWLSNNDDHVWGFDATGSALTPQLAGPNITATMPAQSLSQSNSSIYLVSDTSTSANSYSYTITSYSMTTMTPIAKFPVAVQEGHPVSVMPPMIRSDGSVVLTYHFNATTGLGWTAVCVDAKLTAVQWNTTVTSVKLPPFENFQAIASMSADNSLYVVLNGALHSYTLTGQVKWAPVGSGIVSFPSVDSAGNIYVVAASGVQAFRGSDGSLLWTWAPPTSVVIGAGVPSRVTISNTGLVAALNPSTGVILS